MRLGQLRVAARLTNVHAPRARARGLGRMPVRPRPSVGKRRAVCQSEAQPAKSGRQGPRGGAWGRGGETAHAYERVGCASKPGRPVGRSARPQVLRSCTWSLSSAERPAVYLPVAPSPLPLLSQASSPRPRGQPSSFPSLSSPILAPTDVPHLARCSPPAHHPPSPAPSLRDLPAPAAGDPRGTLSGRVERSGHVGESSPEVRRGVRQRAGKVKGRSRERSEGAERAAGRRKSRQRSGSLRASCGLWGRVLGKVWS
jgi:hypothetical protein